MSVKHALIAKITRPNISGVLPRKRLFQLIDTARKRPITWISGPAGMGKTTLVASYLDNHKLPCIWYQVDGGDADIATFFHYMGLAAKKAAPRNRKPLPLLTPEYLLGIPTFTKRYFEQLYSRLKPFTPLKSPLAKGGYRGVKGEFKGGGGFIIILDNYQLVPSDSQFHEVIRDGLSIIPEGINVIIISRSEPLSQFAPFTAGNRMSYIGCDMLRFTPEESKKLIESGGRKGISDTVLKELYDKTLGWAAGLVLIMEMAKRRGIAPRMLSGQTPDEIFDYFAGEIFDKTDRATQEFLLKTSFLPKMTAPMAEKLTEVKNAGEILSHLSRNHYFTAQHSAAEPIYQYHPLFRDFLSSRSRERFSQEDLSRVQRSAAIILKESGNIEEAIALFRQAEEWNEVASLTCQYVPSLLAQGRYQTVREWLNSLPQEMVEGTPDLLCLRGACLMPFDLHQSRNNFEKAFASNQILGDPVRLFLSWEGVVNSLFYAFDDFKPLDDWIVLLEKLLMQYPAFPSEDIEVRVTSIMFYALVWRQPQHPDMTTWTKRMEKLLEKSHDANQKVLIESYLCNYYSLRGEQPKLVTLFDKVRPEYSAAITPMTAILSDLNKATAYLSFALIEESLALVDAGMKKANNLGVHILDFIIVSVGAHAALCASDLPAVSQYLERAAQCLNYRRRFEVSFYSYLKAYEAFLRDDFSSALEYMKKALHLSIEIGVPFPEAECHYGLACIHIALGEHTNAEKELTHLHYICKATGSSLFEFMYLLGQAQLVLEHGDDDEGISFLQGAMALGREKRLVNSTWWDHAVMTRLCMKALEHGIEVEYVQDLIRRRELIPEKPPFEIENWPWALKIHALGRFGLIKDGKPVRFSGKVQKKPLDMLKALIAIGGREVSEDQLTDALWPEADGDAAHSAFSTTLQRLRLLIGNEKAIQLREGKITLDPRYCYVDVWAFERTLSEAEKAFKGKQIDRAVYLSEKAIALYTGDFLAGDTIQPWTISMRERLRSKYIRAIERLGHYWEQKEQWEKAVECCQRGLEVENLAEELYQCLMKCYLKQGRKAEALTVYNRCKKTLAAMLGIEPSAKTEMICKNIKNHSL